MLKIWLPCLGMGWRLFGAFFAILGVGAIIMGKSSDVATEGGSPDRLIGLLLISMGVFTFLLWQKIELDKTLKVCSRTWFFLLPIYCRHHKLANNSRVSIRSIKKRRTGKHDEEFAGVCLHNDSEDIDLYTTCCYEDAKEVAAKIGAFLETNVEDFCSHMNE